MTDADAVPAPAVADAAIDENKAPEAELDDEDYGGGLDEDAQMLTLKSGGQAPKTFELDRKSAELSKFVTTILEGDETATSIEIRQVPPETLEHVITYLQHHKGKEPDPLPCPVRSIHMSQIVSDKWDATWIDAFDKKTIFEIILAANYMDIKSLLHLGCAKIATLIKQLDQKEINRIIEEEEKYRREHAQSNENAADDAKNDN